MISKELIAQATLAYQNWRSRNPDSAPAISEEAFVQKFQELQTAHYRGLLGRPELDQRIDELLRNPGMAMSVGQFVPAEKPVEALLAELERLKKSGVLNDEEFESRKAELLFGRGLLDQEQSGAAPAVVPPVAGGESPDAQKARFASYLDELLRAGILTHPEYTMGMQRLGR